MIGENRSFCTGQNKTDADVWVADASGGKAMPSCRYLKMARPRMRYAEMYSLISRLRLAA
ncbi:hypothetical protein [Ruminococcus albus]|uniref:hypothetical protein n=1 Tax=Ruminococcus albus TaxID=1264 RepID=UPI0004B60E58|nr:hypothetical protein [Ruminococcus albus]